MSEDIVSSFKIPLKKKKVITERGVLQLTASSMARAKRKTERITIKESDKKRLPCSTEAVPRFSLSEKKMTTNGCNGDCFHPYGGWVNETWNGQVEVVSCLYPVVEAIGDVGESVGGI